MPVDNISLFKEWLPWWINTSLYQRAKSFFLSDKPPGLKVNFRARNKILKFIETVLKNNFLLRWWWQAQSWFFRWKWGYCVSGRLYGCIWNINAEINRTGGKILWLVIETSSIKEVKECWWETCEIEGLGDLFQNLSEASAESGGKLATN